MINLVIDVEGEASGAVGAPEGDIDGEELGGVEGVARDAGAGSHAGSPC
jgi:hypothetical protein